MWKQILAAALSAVTAAIEAVTAAIEAGTADQYNCITAQNTADVPLLYGKGLSSKFVVLTMHLMGFALIFNDIIFPGG